MQDALAARLLLYADRVRLRVYESVTSTNDLLRNAADAGAPEGTVVIAQQQTAGKGRQGRSFYSPPQTGLYLSMLLRPKDSQILALTPMAAAAAAAAVEQCTGVPVQIKWVNDLLLHGRKFCGILAESQFSAAQSLPDYVILGIGINLLPPPDGFPPELRDIACAVYPPDADPTQCFLDCAAALIASLLREYDCLSEKHYLAEYKKRLCVLNRDIIVNENGVEHPARAIAVDDDLRLLVRYADGTEQWRATGEIRVHF